MVLSIRPALVADHETAWRVFHEVVTAGDTYAYPPDTTRQQALAPWFAEGGWTYVAEVDGEGGGTYRMKPNEPGHGSHTANCGYMVARAASGRGIGETMCRHSMDEARRRGFRAMQFNFVVSTNTRAVALWQKCGFEIVGTVPGAFHHPTKGYVDTYVMHRFL